MNPYREPSPPLPPLPESLVRRVGRVASAVLRGVGRWVAWWWFDVLLVGACVAFVGGISWLLYSAHAEEEERCQRVCAEIGGSVFDSTSIRCTCLGEGRLVHFDSDWRPTEVRLSEEP